MNDNLDFIHDQITDAALDVFDTAQGSRRAEPVAVEDMVIFTEPDIHDITAAHGLPEHQLDVLEAEIIVAVTTEARCLDAVDYELRLWELRAKVNALPPALQAELRARFSMEVRA